MSDRSASVIDLLANPKRAARLAERERIAKVGDQGWLGLTRRAKPQLSFHLGDGVIEIDCHPRSVAFRDGVRTGDVIRGIRVPDFGNVTLDRFNELHLPRGVRVQIDYSTPGVTGKRSEWREADFKLGRWPSKREWETRPRVAPGRRVLQCDRGEFLQNMRQYLPTVMGKRSKLGYLYVEMLVRDHDNDANEGVWPSQGGSAKKLNVSREWVSQIDAMLRWFGVLKFIRGPIVGVRPGNTVQVCWPALGEATDQPPPLPPKPSATIRRGRFGDFRGTKS